MYIALFQVPILPGLTLRAANYRVLAGAIQSGGKLRDEELAYFREAWWQPGVLHAEINWYRRLFQVGNLLSNYEGYLRMPVRIIWGLRDFALTTRVAEWSRDYCANSDLHYIREASHFVQQEAPEEFKALLLPFLDKSRNS